MTRTTAVARRELLHFLRALGRAGITRLFVVFFVIFAVFVPMRSETDSPDLFLVIFAMLPVYLAGPGAVDAFAGERERETLETLLTAPLSAAELVWGKLLAVMAYALAFSWAPMLFFCLLSLLRGNGLPSAAAMPVVAVAGLLAAFISSAVGVSISARARSVRSAQHWFALIVLALFVGLPLGARYLVGAIPVSVARSIGDLFHGGWFSTGTLLLLLAMLLCAVPCGFYMYRRTALLWRMNRA